MEITSVQEQYVWVSTADLIATVRNHALPSSDTKRLAELVSLAEYTLGIKEAINPMLVTQNMFDNLQTAWSNVSQHLNNYLGDPVSYTAHLDMALSALDQVRNVLATFPITWASSQARAALTRSLNSYRAQFDEAVAALEQRIQVTVENSADREKQSDSRSNELEIQLADLQKSANALSARIADDEARLSEALAQNNKLFLESQSGQDKDFREWLKLQEAEFEELANPHMTGIKKDAEKVKAALSEVEELRDQTVELASIVAGDVIAGKFAGYAKQEKVASFVGYGIGLAALVGIIVLILVAFGEITSSLRWENVSLKLALSVTAGGLATVAFRYGGQATQRATSFKRQELELRSILPFLKDVEGEDEAKVAFFERAFGHAWRQGDAVPQDVNVNEDLLKIVLSMAQAASKEAGKAVS